MSAHEVRNQLTGVFGKRYAEVLLIHPGEPNSQASVYSSTPLDDFPTELWSVLDPQTVAAEHGASRAVLDGPRCWLVNSIEQAPQTPAAKTFGDIEMRQLGTLLLPSATLARMNPEPYVAKQVTRDNVLVFDAGRRIYELVDPVGRRWVMQSFSQIMDPTLSLADLPTLGERLALPPGWAYRSQTLAKPLRVDSTARHAQIIVDNLGNLYSLLAG